MFLCFTGMVEEEVEAMEVVEAMVGVEATEVAEAMGGVEAMTRVVVTNGST